MTRAPSGQRTTTRQSPISSTKRSMTIARSLGTSPVAATWSRTYAAMASAAAGSSA